LKFMIHYLVTGKGNKKAWTKKNRERDPILKEIEEEIKDKLFSFHHKKNRLFALLFIVFFTEGTFQIYLSKLMFSASTQLSSNW